MWPPKKHPPAHSLSPPKAGGFADIISRGAKLNADYLSEGVKVARRLTARSPRGARPRRTFLIVALMPAAKGSVTPRTSAVPTWLSSPPSQRTKIRTNFIYCLQQRCRFILAPLPRAIPKPDRWCVTGHIVCYRHDRALDLQIECAYAAGSCDLSANRHNRT